MFRLNPLVESIGVGVPLISTDMNLVTFLCIKSVGPGLLLLRFLFVNVV